MWPSWFNTNFESRIYGLSLCLGTTTQRKNLVSFEVENKVGQKKKLITSIWHCNTLVPHKKASKEVPQVTMQPLQKFLPAINPATEELSSLKTCPTTLNSWFCSLNPLQDSTLNPCKISDKCVRRISYLWCFHKVLVNLLLCHKNPMFLREVMRPQHTVSIYKC
jgi:hypothetical protein